MKKLQYQLLICLFNKVGQAEIYDFLSNVVSNK